MPVEPIYDDDNVTVFYRRGIAGTIVVTFTPMTDFPKTQFWGQVPITKLNLPCIGISPKRSHWYPDSFMDQAIAAAKTITDKFENRIGYGYSMGGFGAIKYAPIFRFDQTFAFSPQYSIDPAIVGDFDKRYKEHYIPDNMGDRATAWRRGSTYIVYDPLFTADARHAQLIDSRQCCRHVMLKGMGHSTIDAVVGTKRFKHLISHGHKPTILLSSQINRWKRDTAAYKAWLAQRLHLNGRKQLALELAKCATQSDPKNKYARKILILVTNDNLK